MTSGRKTLDVHIGVWSPSRWDEIDHIRAAAHPDAWGKKERPPITIETIGWEQMELTPRWIGEDSSEAVAAIEPSRFHNSGAQEWHRFRAGAAARNELALAISTLRPAAESTPVSLGGPATSVGLPGADASTVGGRQIALASAPQLAPGVGDSLLLLKQLFLPGVNKRLAHITAHRVRSDPANDAWQVAEIYWSIACLIQRYRPVEPGSKALVRSRRRTPRHDTFRTRDYANPLNTRPLRLSPGAGDMPQSVREILGCLGLRSGLLPDAASDELPGHGIRCVSNSRRHDLAEECGSAAIRAPPNYPDPWRLGPRWARTRRRWQSRSSARLMLPPMQLG